MAASVECRPEDRSLRLVMKDVDGDLAAFLEMRKREKETNGPPLRVHIPDGFDDVDDSTDSIFRETLVKMAPACNFMDAEGPKSDYDWLLTPPSTPPVPPLEVAVQSANSQDATLDSLTDAQTPKMENPPGRLSSLRNLRNPSAQPTTSTSESSSVSKTRWPSSGMQKSTASRSATPNGRTLPATSRPSRSSTPTSRGITTSSKPVAPPVRSSTPTRATARASTPPARSSIPATSKSTSRPATTTLKSSTPSSATTTSAPSRRSSSMTKAVPTMLKNLETSHGGNFPRVKSRPKTTSETPIIPSDAPSNLTMTMPKRPSSASKGRPTTLGSLSSSNNLTNVRPRQKSCSPTRGRGKDGNLNTRKTVVSKSRGYSNGNDDVNPVLIGTKMVERVVNMRKLAPPKHDNHESHENSSSQDISGFGRSLSKKSLDMAIRHMDIRRSISGNLKTIVASVPASSTSSRRTGSAKTWTSSSDSPLATCSNNSSEPSVHNNDRVLDGSDVEVYDIGGEMESLPSDYQS